MLKMKTKEDMKHATEFYDSIPKELDPRCLEVALDLARQASESLYANYNNVKKLCTTLLGWTVAASISLVAAIVAQIPNGWNLQMIMTAYGLALSLTTSLVIILGGLFKRDWYLPGLEPTSCLSKARLKYLITCSNQSDALIRNLLFDLQCDSDENTRRLSEIVRIYRLTVRILVGGTIAGVILLSVLALACPCSLV